MQKLSLTRLVAASLGALALAACGGPQSNMPTSNPSTTLATDSAAGKVRVSGPAGTLGERPNDTIRTR